MAYKDLRKFIEVLKKKGLLKLITAEVDPVLEIAEINDRVVKTGGSALFLRNLKIQNSLVW